MKKGKRQEAKPLAALPKRGQHKEMKKRRLRDVLLIKKPVAIIFLIVFFLLLIIVLGNFLEDIFEFFHVKTPTCGDGSFYNTCSLNKPYFCENGKLLEKASICSCPDGFERSEDFCVFKYHTNPKNISLNYILRGKESSINFVAYEGAYNHLSNLPKTIFYYGSEQPSRVDFKLKYINEPVQREFLIPLVVKIQNLADKKEDQMRIAVNLVQNIPFGASNKTTPLLGNYSIDYSRYPYEVLYDGKGICGEKAELLAFLLKEIDYGVVIFYYPLENHEAVGIKCPTQHGLGDTGYCFIETSGPAIISDDEIEYAGNLKLISEPEIMLISDGISLGNIYEYKDAESFKKIRRSLKDGRLNSDETETLKKLKQKYGLVEIYRV